MDYSSSQRKKLIAEHKLGPPEVLGIQFKTIYFIEELVDFLEEQKAVDLPGIQQFLDRGHEILDEASGEG